MIALMAALIVGLVVGWLFVHFLVPVFLIALVYVAFQDQINPIVGGVWGAVGDINLIEAAEFAFTIAVVGLILGAIAWAVWGASGGTRTKHYRASMAWRRLRGRLHRPALRRQ